MGNKNELDQLNTKENVPQTDTNQSSLRTTASDLFGEMRGSTDEERTAYSDMLTDISTPLDIDIFSD